MLRTFAFLLIPTLFGLGATVAGAIAPTYLPNLSPSAVHWLFWGGISLCCMMFVDGALLFYWAGTLRENWASLIWINAGLFCVAVGLISHHVPPGAPLAKVSLPGVGVFAIIEIRDVAQVRRRYVFDLGEQDGARASFYLSASDKFTFQVTDTRGEAYPLEFPTGGKTLVIGVPAYLILECGIINSQTIIHAVVNGVEVARRVLPFAISLGGGEFKDITVGANKDKTEFGGFVLGEFGILKGTMSETQYEQMNTYIRNKYHLVIL